MLFVANNLTTKVNFRIRPSMKVLNYLYASKFNSTIQVVSKGFGLLTSIQLQSLEVFLLKRFKKVGKTVFKIFPHLSKTKKGLGSRMGRGKGIVSCGVVSICPGTTIIEIDTSSLQHIYSTIKQIRLRFKFKLQINIS